MRKWFVSVLVSVGLVAMVGCDGGGGGSGSGGDSGGDGGGDGGDASVLASGSTVISGGGHKLATVTAPSDGLLRWTVTRVAGGTDIIGLSADIIQGDTTLAHDATQESTISISTAVSAGGSYDLFGSTSDTDVSITYTARME